MKNFQENFINVFRYKYFDFKGRSRRKEYWMFIVWAFIFGIVAGFLSNSILGESVSNILRGIITILFVIPSIALSVRRLHDTNRSGWWILLSFIPLLGAIVLLVFYVQKGTVGDNKYGKDPRSIEEPVVV